MAYFLAIKAFLKKIWDWCKKYWQILLGAIIPLFLWFAFRKKNSSGDQAEVLDRVRDDHRRDIEAIDESRRLEESRVQEAIDRREATIAQIEQKYAEAHVELDSRKKDRVRGLVDQYGDDPDELTRQLARAIGVSVWTGGSK